ncbi:MAG: tyrosine-protein phosphatase [Verrucomicrobia bacterium]|nr:tyrosine-protein phosphatase [Verrucomicrobiota bacterium]
MNSEPSLPDIADRLLAWSKQDTDVQALFWFGSYSIKQPKADSDLDVAILLRSLASRERCQRAIIDLLAPTLRISSANIETGRFFCLVGSNLKKVEVVIATDPEDLAWLADCSEVPAPRLVLAFQRDEAGQDLVKRANRQITVDARRRVDEEVDKFLEGYESASRAHARSDAYAFYFHYNLALQRLVRLATISRRSAQRLYLSPQFTNDCLRLEERKPFCDLAAPMHLGAAAAAKARLRDKFLEFLAELRSGSIGATRTPEELKPIFDALWERDFFFNLRDVAEHWGPGLRRGQLFRSGTLTRWQHDAYLRQWLGRNGITSLIDLRTREPDDGPEYDPGPISGLKYHHLPISTARSPEFPDGNDGDVRGQWYVFLVETQTSQFAGSLKAIAHADGSALIHCYAGMDRTGIVVALLGVLLGIRRERIIDDFMASGPFVRAMWIETLLNWAHSPEHLADYFLSHGFADTDLAKLKARFAE